MVKAINDNKLGILFLALAVLVGGTLFTMQGCTLEDTVKVDVPHRIQDSIGVPAIITLAESAYVYDEWMSQVRLDAKQFTASIAQGNRVAGFLRSLVSLGLSSAEVPLSGVPGGALILSGLTGLAGLFVRKPGTQSEVDNAYDLGRREALDTLAKAP